MEALGIYDAATMKLRCSFKQEFVFKPAELKIDSHGIRFAGAACNLKTPAKEDRAEQDKGG